MQVTSIASLSNREINASLFNSIYLGRIADELGNFIVLLI